MDILLIVLGILCLLVGLAGCIIPMLPGPPVAYIGIVLLHLTSQTDFTTTQLTVWLLLVVVVQVLDYLVPTWGTRYIGGSRSGSRGCLMGTLVGLWFMPWGIVLGPFIGAFVGELLAGHSTGLALRSGFGSLLGFLFGTVLKCMVCGYFVWRFFAAIF